VKGLNPRFEIRMLDDESKSTSVFYSQNQTTVVEIENGVWRQENGNAVKMTLLLSNVYCIECEMAECLLSGADGSNWDIG